MTKNDLCLEEYISLVSQFVYGEHHLEFTDDSGNNYEIYFVPADMSADSTNVPVPAGKKYDISGNNIDGFIVTLYKNGDEYIRDGEEKNPAPSAGYTAGGTDEEAANAENPEEPSTEAEEAATEAEQAEEPTEAPAEESAE